MCTSMLKAAVKSLSLLHANNEIVNLEKNNYSTQEYPMLIFFNPLLPKQNMWNLNASDWEKNIPRILFLVLWVLETVVLIWVLKKKSHSIKHCNSSLVISVLVLLETLISLFWIKHTEGCLNFKLHKLNKEECAS